MLPVRRNDADEKALPPDVMLRPLVLHRDARGSLAEFFRQPWCTNFQPRQWQVTVSEADSLRGMHLHLSHTDYLVALDGVLAVGLHDLRRGSPAYGRGLLLALDGAQPAALTIPPGVAHGVFCRTRTVYVIGIDREYDRDDELGCRWDDAGLGIAWPSPAPLLSARDAALPSLRELAQRVPVWR
jgi:dTDP-4-dehydrorhamnose 3,5-epimerase